MSNYKLTPNEINELFLSVEEILKKEIETVPLDSSSRMQLLFSLINAVRLYAASGNSIPGLRGLGLDETITLAQSIIAKQTISEKEILIYSYKNIAKSISFK